MLRVMFVSLSVLSGLCCFCLALAAITFSDFATWMPGVRTPLGQTAGIVTDNTFTYVASKRTGRIYKYSGDGNCVGWKSVEKRPISIAALGGKIVVAQGGDRIEINDAAFVSGHVSDAAIQVQSSLLGHPYLQAVDGSHRPLQPWYLTAVQEPWPGFVWWPLMICAWYPIARACNRRIRLAGAPQRVVTSN
jgi:hypothetical protein